MQPVLALKLVGNPPPDHTLQSWARTVLSMSIASTRDLGDYLSGVDLKRAKEVNYEQQEAARTILRNGNPSKTIWYYKQAPTMGNKWRTK